MGKYACHSQFFVFWAWAEGPGKISSCFFHEEITAFLRQAKRPGLRVLVNADEEPGVN